MRLIKVLLKNSEYRIMSQSDADKIMPEVVKCWALTFYTHQSSGITTVIEIPLSWF
jgi:hypothetical protein